MIHPQYWSLHSIYKSLENKFYRFVYKVTKDSGMHTEDIKCYTSLDVKGKVVLDIGAYNGDSAKLFLDLGAKHVICVEAVEECAKQINLPNTTVLNEPFKLEHLDMDYDCIKMDIEGWEALVLEYYKPLKPMALEVHSGYLMTRFLEKGFHVFSTRKGRKYERSVSTWLMTNF